MQGACAVDAVSHWLKLVVEGRLEAAAVGCQPPPQGVHIAIVIVIKAVALLAGSARAVAVETAADAAVAGAAVVFAVIDAAAGLGR